jgi:hypothetical protein
MVAFEVRLNGKLLCTAGADDLSSLTTCLSLEGQLGDHTVLEGDKAKLKGTIKPSLLISGGKARKGFRWSRDVQVTTGDVLEVRLVQVAPNVADPPDPITSGDPKREAEFERMVFETSKQRYLQLREKYEPPDNS